MGVPYFEPDIHGTVELISRRVVHVDKRDKVLMVYTYTCAYCDFTATRIGLDAVRKRAAYHQDVTHNGVISPKLAQLVDDVSKIPGTLNRDDPPPF